LALSQRGKVVAGIAAAIAVLIVGIGAWAFATGRGPVEAVRDAAGALPGVPDPEPPKCPLTGEDAPGGVIPDRTVAAVKVENTDDARPQAGLDRADIVYEELVEGGITRFIAMYHCDDASIVGPVRSARTTDPDVLLQYGRPILAYSGGTSRVQKLVARSGVFDFNEDSGGEAFQRDAGRVEPHNLFVNTTKLRKIAGKKADRQDAPEPPFTYGDWEGKSKKATDLTMVFSTLNTVGWEWSKKDDAWLRIDNGSANVLENGDRVSASNVIVQFVKVSEGDIQDVTGSPSPEVTLTGGGKAYVFRDGRVIPGTWERNSLGDVTTFQAKDGAQIPLVPGQTWIELYPAKGDFADASIDFGK
jgi:hypothetical protein